ncbi:MAG: DnaJ family molecular chaperone [Hyphomicrobiaceae bacterium]|jgi:hypothetical protein
MFERGRIDAVPETSPVPVEILFLDGEVVKGKLRVAVGKTIADTLNGSGGFVEFEPYGGERGFVAKAQLASIKPVGIPKAPSLRERLEEVDAFDPFAILGITRGTKWDEVRSAYLSLAKSYHPDRYANAELPAEVREYLDVMARRINSAYAALEVPPPAKRQMPVSQPVYTTPMRA